MLISKSSWFGAAALVVAASAVATPVAGQYMGGGSKTAAETQVADLEQMRDKFKGLAEAFPDSSYDWRPMTGVRSVREVLTLVVNEAALFPTMWEFDKPAWVPEASIAAEQVRVSDMTKAQLASELQRSFDHLLAIVGGLSEADRTRRVTFFGLDVDLATAIGLMSNDMHEHLGQAIAYARTNGVVPPWSRG